MSFEGFDSSAIELLTKLPAFDAKLGRGKGKKT